MQKIFTSYYGNRQLDRRTQLLVRVSNSAPPGVAADAVLAGAVPDWGTIVAPYDRKRQKAHGFNRGKNGA